MKSLFTAAVGLFLFCLVGRAQISTNYIAETVTPDIQALARGLQNDPLQIFQYVHDHISHEAYFASKKGAELTLLEGSGNDFDQCALLVSLLSAAGYTNNTGYQFGWMEIPYDNTNHLDIHHWLGLSLQNTNWSTTFGFVNGILCNSGTSKNRGYPSLMDMGDDNTFGILHIWVTFTNNGTVYYLDPDLKDYEPVAGINLVAATGVSSNTLYNAAGGTNTALYCQNLNEVMVRSNLNVWNNQFLSYLNSNLPNASVENILGGQAVVPWTNQLSQSLAYPVFINLPYTPLASFAYIPTNCMCTFTLGIGNYSTNWYFPQLQGQRLSLTTSNSIASIWLEDNLVVRTNIFANLSAGKITVGFSYTFPYGGGINDSTGLPVDGGGADYSISAQYNPTNSFYNICYGFRPGVKWLNKRQSVLNYYFQLGYTNGSRQIVTETLNVMGLTYYLQDGLLSDGILAQELGATAVYAQKMGRMAQEAGSGYYIDLYGINNASYVTTGAGATDVDNFNKFYDIKSYFGSALEHGIVEQSQNSGIVGASTVKMLQLANTNKYAVYLVNASNWATGSNIQSKISSTYSAVALNMINTSIANGDYLLLPANGSIAVSSSGDWKGVGYVDYGTNPVTRAIGMTISGGYNGGFSSLSSATVNPAYQQATDISQPNSFNLVQLFSMPVFSADPVEMDDASFRLNTTDISVGGADPCGMSMNRYYSPTFRQVNLANNGYGWVNSYYFKLSEISAPEASFGLTTPAQMAPALVATAAATQLYASLFNGSQPNPKNWMITVLIAKWCIDQAISNSVSIEMGQQTLQFVRQPNGSYTPPANCTWTLTNNGTYKLQERHGRLFTFDSSKELASITNQSGAAMAFTYTGTNLTKVTDWKKRTLTLGYSGNPARLATVTDSTGRSVSYTYTTNADKQLDLSSFTDAQGATSTYIYDTNHQIVATYDALGRLVVSNNYDPFGRVVTQYTQGLTNKTWNIFWSDWQTLSQDPAGNYTKYLYDNNHLLLKKVDPLGNVSQSVYDGQNHVVTNISPLNEISQSFYDANQNMIASVDPLGFTNQYIYDANNDLVQTLDPRGNSSYFGYDSEFRLIGTTNAMGDWKTYAYNSDGTVATITTPAGATTFSYDAFGKPKIIIYPNGLGTEGFLNSTNGDVLSHTNARGFITSYQYDNRRELTNTIAPTNYVAKAVYDAIGNQVSATDARGNTTTNSWNVLHHLISTTLPSTPAGTATITNGYDNRDWLIQTADPFGNPTAYANDAAQRQIAVTDPLSRTTSYTYDSDNRKVAVTNGLQQVSVVNYDARNSIVLTADGVGRTARYAFDGADNQIILTNRNGNLWQFKFDVANRLTNTITPLGRNLGQTYNNRGLVASSTEPSGNTQTFSYDAKNRLTNRTDNVATTINNYDANDNPTNMLENGNTNTWVYDAYDRVVSYTDTLGNNIQYRYDANNNLTNLVYPGGRNVYYAYDSLNHLTNVIDWAGRSTAIKYDLDGRMTSLTRPNGTVRSQAYDAAGQTTVISETTSGGATIALYKFGWDNAGRMSYEYGAPLPQSSTIPTRNMMFDKDNRLSSIDGNTVVNDLDGNMTSGPLTNDTLVAYTYDARNRLLNVGGVTNVYDAMNNRIAQSFGTNTVAYVINPNSKLPQVLMRIKNGVTNYYVYGAGLLYQVTEQATGTNTLTYHYDYRGSTVALTDGTGTNVTDRIQYSAYATTTYRSGITDTPFLFNGRYGVMTDPNGLLYMKARYYNPFVCRFINPDPTGFSGGLNFYAFANGNPVCYSDPFGLSAIGDYFSGVGQVFEGYGLAIAGTATGLYNVAMHPINTAVGLYNVAANPVQAYNAVSTSVANTWNSGLEGQGQILGNVFIAAATAGSGVATATTRAAAIAAAEPELTEGMSTLQILSTYDQGAQALNDADYAAYGAELTSPLYKGLLMQQGVNLAGDAYSITTPLWQQIGTSLTLVGTGLTPSAAIVPGVLGAGAEATGWLGNAGLLGGTTTQTSSGNNK